MGLRNWLKRHDEQVDTSWTEKTVADAGFEEWYTQQGTNFLPPDTSGWPVAGMSPELTDAVQNQWYASSYSHLYRSQPAVYTVVEFLAWQISQLSLKVYRRKADDDREHLAGSELERLLHDPAPGMTYSRLMRDTMADMGVYGNAYWALMEAPSNVGSKLIVPLPAQYVVPRGGSLLEANTYEYTGGTLPQYFKNEEICHFRRYNPDDKRIGVSPLEVLRGITNEESEMTRYRRVLWQKDARMAGFIRRPLEANPMDEDSRTRFRLGMEKFGKGGKNEGSWMLLEEGEQPFPIAFSPKDAEYIEGRKLALETVARAYNIPLAVLSLTETATYASQKEFHQALYRDTLPPWTRNIEDEVMAKVVPWVLGTTQNSDIYVEFNLAEKLQGAFEEAATMLLQAVGGPYMTRAEARARLNLPKLDEDEVDDLVVTNNMVGTVGMPPPPPPAAAGPPALQLAPPQEEGTAP
jgi:HK97 family phage portal protein